jgi:hypothetical protein
MNRYALYPSNQPESDAPKASQHGVAAFVEWAAHEGNCPFIDAEKRALWSATAAGCSRLHDWEVLDAVLADLIDTFGDSKLRSVPRRLRRAAREFVSAR